jgi:glutathionyl-hydroquinone reductase
MRADPFDLYILVQKTYPGKQPVSVTLDIKNKTVIANQIGIRIRPV